MVPHIEILYHMHCDACNKWWSFADIKPTGLIHCPHCGKEHHIEGFKNGNEEEVTGIAWIKDVKRQLPLVYELEGDDLDGTNG